MVQVLLAHAEGEESLAEQIAEPLRRAGYGVVHYEALLVGQSLAEEASKAIAQGSPVVLCGTVKAAGTGWAYRLVNAVRKHSGVRIFALKMEEDAFLDILTLDGKVAPYWQDPGRATADLMAALAAYYPPGEDGSRLRQGGLEQRYREIALKTCDIVDLANLPIGDRDLVTKELLLRSLYVSIRVAVEIPPGIDPSDLNSKLRSIESRRGDFGDEDEHRARLSIGERLAASKRLVVLGDPGAGKSTLLRWIATAYLLRLRSDPDWSQLPDVATLPDVDWLPLLIRCRDLDAKEGIGSLEEIVRHHLRKSGFSEQEAGSLTDVLLTGLRDGRVLLLIDGLDEIADPALRARFCRQIEQIHVACPDASIIVTSRIVGYKEMGLRITRGFEHVTVLDLTPGDKDDFARRWCMVTESLARQETAARELINDIHSADRIERLTGNPMLLTTMALVKKKVGKLPSRRADLYREAVDVLLNWRSDVDEQLDRYEALPQLQYLAHSMCEAGVQQLREDEVIDTLERMRREFPKVRATRQHSARAFLRVLEGRTGILAEAGHVRHRGRLVPVYEFRHLTFQEYLAGLALVEGRFPGRDRDRSLADHVAVLAAETSPASFSLWHEAIRLCVMSCNDDDVDSVLLAVVRPLPGEDADTTAKARAGLACSCLSDEPNVSEEVAREIIDRFVDVLTAEARDGGVDSISDPAAVEIASSLWGAELGRRLVATWLRDADGAIRLAGLAATVTATTAPADEIDFERWMRNQAALLADPRAEVATEAALALMEIAFTGRAVMVPDLISGLIAMLSRGPCEANAAAWALGWLTASSTVIESHGPWQPTTQEVDLLVHAIEDYDFLLPDTVRLLLWSLNPQTGKRHPGLAAKVMTWFERAHPKRRAIFTDSYANVFRDAVDPVLPYLDHEDEAVRRQAVSILTRLDSPRIEGALLAVLPGLSGGDHDRAVRALGRVRGPQTLDRLLEILARAEGTPDETVIEAIGQFGDPRAVEPLLAVLADADSSSHRAIAEALAQIGDPRALQPLRDLRRPGDLESHLPVLTALASLGDTDARHDVKQAMRGGTSATRRGALWGLAAHEPLLVDRVLLSRDEDGQAPGIDPADEVSERDLTRYAAATDLPEDAVRARYEALAGRYPLTLSWLGQDHE